MVRFFHVFIDSSNYVSDERINAVCYSYLLFEISHNTVGCRVSLTAFGTAKYRFGMKVIKIINIVPRINEQISNDIIKCS